MTVQERVTTIEVFDPAMCCSTGVCGPSIDPALAQFAADLDWLDNDDAVVVTRYNLTQQPEAFAAREDVKAVLQEHGESCLPLIFVDGRLASQGAYPPREDLAAMADVTMPATAPSLWSPEVKELVAIAAAIGSNCEPCLEHHVGVARDLAVSDDDLARAVRMAKAVKETPARKILARADELLGNAQTSTTDSTASSSSGGCCS